MSNRPVIIVLLLTLLLAAGAYFTLKPAATNETDAGVIAQNERLLPLDPATVRGFTIDNPPSKQQVVEHAQDGRWLWRNSPTDTHKYALDESAVRAFLRKIAEYKSVATPPSANPVPQNPPPIVLTFQTSTGNATIRLAPRALGGQVLADVKAPPGFGRAAIVGDDLLTLLTNPGPSAWRDTRALPADAANAARITFTDGSGTKGFGLARRPGGQYAVTTPAPVTAPASMDVVSGVIRTLNGITISRFYDEGARLTRESTGLDKPSAILTLEIDDRSIDAATQQPVTATRTYRLLIGQPADTTGTTLYASPDDGDTIFAIVATPLSGLTGPVSNLIARNATGTPAADAGSLELASTDGKHTVKLTRDAIAARWTETVDGAAPVTQSAAEAQGSESVIAFFTGSLADAVAFEPPPDAARVAAASLLSPGGQPLDRFDIFQSPKGAVTLAAGGVYRTYAKPPDDLVRWLKRVTP